MLFAIAAALAAPLSPVAPTGPGLDLALGYATSRALLRDADCAGPTAACDAVRIAAGGVAQVGLQIATPVGVYVQGRSVGETLAGASYEGAGWGVAAGARVGVPLGDLVGVHGWGELSWERTTAGEDDAGSAATRWQAEVGAALRYGAPEEGFYGWAGVQALPWTDDRARVLGGGLPLDLAARLPVEATLGAAWASESLAGPWNDRSRLSVGIDLTLGHRTGVAGFVGVAL